MIEPVTSIVLVGFGAALMLAGIVAGCMLDMRYLNRRFMKPLPKAAPITQQIPAVKP
jgi:hypothetical protein